MLVPASSNWQVNVPQLCICHAHYVIETQDKAELIVDYNSSPRPMYIEIVVRNVSNFALPNYQNRNSYYFSLIVSVNDGTHVHFRFRLTTHTPAAGCSTGNRINGDGELTMWSNCHHQIL